MATKQERRCKDCTCYTKDDDGEYCFCKGVVYDLSGETCVNYKRIWWKFWRAK